MLVTIFCAECKEGSRTLINLVIFYHYLRLQKDRRMKSSELQRLNDLGASLFEEGRFTEARNLFVSSLEMLKKGSLQREERRISPPPEISTMWSEAPEESSTCSISSAFVWMRTIRILSDPICFASDTPAIVAILTFNSALCLNMTAMKTLSPQLIKWVIQIYRVVLKLLRQTKSKRLAEGLKIAIYNNLANLNCQRLDYCEAYRWYGLLSKHLENATHSHDEIVENDRAGIVANLLFCCKPHVAGAA